MTEIHYADLMKKGIIPAGTRRIVQLGKDRFLVYLPKSLNYVWKELKQKDAKIRLYVEVLTTSSETDD